MPSWYKLFPWVHFCSKNLKAYCFYCKKANKLHVTVMSTKSEPAFVTTGFSNWKKATLRFKEHELSQAHRDAISAHVSATSIPVSRMLQSQFNGIQVSRRNSLMKQLKALRYLLRQGLSIRNDHAGGSNLTIMLQQVLDEVAWVETNEYQSPEIINEMIKLMALKVLRSLVNALLSQRWFSLLADETRDISNREQLVVTLRWVSESYEIYEDFFGLVELDATTAECIYSSLKNCLISLGIPFDHCRGQGYDGARNFQGHVSGVGKRFENGNHAAITVHCLAHCVNLCLQDIARDSKSMKEALNFAMEVVQLIKYSPKRQVVFERVQKELDDSSKSGIRTFCPTRWTVRTGAIRAILDNYESLHITLEESSHGSDDCSRRACGLLALMDKFHTYFGLKLAFLIFSITEQLSVTLQGVNTNVDDCYVAVKVTV